VTILIGILLSDSVLFLADTVTNTLNPDGTKSGILSDKSQKIRKIRKEVAMSTTGLGTLGQCSAQLIETIISN
jgi:hypothetical protein